MDLRLLEVFCRVFQARSFSRAARELALAQPTVSIHIRELEQSLGVTLFNRLGREIQPTEAGQVLYEHSKSILSLKSEVHERMANFLDRVEGDLPIAASSMPGEYLLPGLVAAFQEEHAGVRARLRISDTADALERLRQGDVQFAAVGGAPTSDDLVFAPFAIDALVLVVPKASPWTKRTVVSVRDLRGVPLLIREPGSGTRTVLEQALARRRFSLESFASVVEFDRTTAIKQAILSGHGVSFVSQLAVAAECASGTLRIVKVRELAPIPRTYFVATSRRRTLSPVARAFVEYLSADNPAAPGRRPAGTRRSH